MRIMRYQGCSEQQGVELAQELTKYRSAMGDYSGLHVNPNTDARLWWQTRGMQSAGSEKLAKLVELLQDIVPHAAAPEPSPQFPRSYPTVRGEFAIVVVNR
jgi:hypothetical protein